MNENSKEQFHGRCLQEILHYNKSEKKKMVQNENQNDVESGFWPEIRILVRKTRKNIKSLLVGKNFSESKELGIQFLGRLFDSPLKETTKNSIQKVKSFRENCVEIKLLKNYAHPRVLRLALNSVMAPIQLDQCASS